MLLPASLLASTLLSPTALAQDDVDVDVSSEAEAPQPAAAPKDKVPLGTQPFVRPIVGATVLTDGTSSYYGANLGLRGGLHIYQEKEGLRGQGTVRAQGQAILGNAFGYDVRLGAFAGPWYEVVGLSTGPDFFYNGYSFGSAELQASPGVSWPITAMFDVKAFNMFAGVEPAWFFSPNRLTVDWSAEPTFGFGGEFTKYVGAGIDLKAFAISVSYSDRTMAFGHDRGFGVGFRL